MSNKETTGTLTDAKVTELDKALASVKARKAAKGSGDTTAAEKPARTPKAPKEPSAPKRPRLTDEEKAARQATKDAEKAAKKAAREAARAAKKLERETAKPPAHMRKVVRAAEKLGTLAQAAELLFNEATANLTAAELATLATHIQHFNRVKATERALQQKLEVGMPVTITSGDARYIGKTGTVFKAQRIRAYITIEGVAKPVYVFTSDVTPLEAAQAATA